MATGSRGSTRVRPPATRRPAGRPVRRRPARRAVLRRWLALLVLFVLTGLVYLVLFTSVLGVRSVEVSGNTGVSTVDIERAAAIADGTPMVRLDTDDARDRIAQLPRIAGVDVSRSWPGTVRITVTERTPVAVLKLPDGVHEVDGTGVDFAVLHKAPAGLPTLVVARVAPDDPATVAAVTVLREIPARLRGQISTITARTPGDVQLTLTGHRTVKWGDAQDSPRKAAVLAVLLTRPGTVYNVASPDAPAVS